MPLVLKALLIIVVPIAAYILFCVALQLKAKWLPRRCPRCRWRALKEVGGMIAHGVDDRGHRHADAWTDYKCGQCHGLFREHTGGRWEEVPPVER